MLTDPDGFQIPVIDGYEATRQIKKQKPDIPELPKRRMHWKKKGQNAWIQARMTNFEAHQQEGPSG
jgi:CheY-like chemotaxis protein